MNFCYLMILTLFHDVLAVNNLLLFFGCIYKTFGCWIVGFFVLDIYYPCFPLFLQQKGCCKNRTTSLPACTNLQKITNLPICTPKFNQPKYAILL